MDNRLKARERFCDIIRDRISAALLPMRNRPLTAAARYEITERIGRSLTGALLESTIPDLEVELDSSDGIKITVIITSPKLGTVNIDLTL